MNDTPAEMTLDELQEYMDNLPPYVEPWTMVSVHVAAGVLYCASVWLETHELLTVEPGKIHPMHVDAEGHPCSWRRAVKASPTGAIECVTGAHEDLTVAAMSLCLSTLAGRCWLGDSWAERPHRTAEQVRRRMLRAVEDASGSDTASITCGEYHDRRHPLK